MPYSEVDWADNELLSQVKLNQMCENVFVTRLANDVRLVAQLISDWDFVQDGVHLPVTLGGITLLSAALFEVDLFGGVITAFDVDISAANNGLIDLYVGAAQIKFWKTPDLDRASVWVSLLGKVSTPPVSEVRIFNATVTAHRNARGGF